MVRLITLLLAACLVAGCGSQATPATPGTATPDSASAAVSSEQPASSQQPAGETPPAPSSESAPEAASSQSEPAAATSHPLQGSYTGSYTYVGPVESYALTVNLNVFTDRGELFAHYSEEGEGYGKNAPYDWPPTLGNADSITGNTLDFVAVKLVNGQFGPYNEPFADVSVTFSGDAAELTISHHVDKVAYTVALTRSS